MTGQELGYLTAALGLAGLVLGSLHRFVVRPIWRLATRTGHFLDSWNGEPARDGLPARPGVVQRITAIEYQLHPNNGGSMKDAVSRIEAKVDGAAIDAAAVKEALERRQDAVENELRLWRSLAARDVTEAANDVLNDRPDEG